MVEKTDEVEPFSVYQDTTKVVLVCKKPEERQVILDGLKKKWMFRKLHKDAKNETDIILECGTVKKADKMLKLILISMSVVRKLPIK